MQVHTISVDQKGFADIGPSRQGLWCMTVKYYYGFNNTESLAMISFEMCE